MCAPTLTVNPVICTCRTTSVATGESVPVAIGRIAATAIMFVALRVIYPVARFTVVAVASLIFHLTIAIAESAVSAVRARRVLRRRALILRQARTRTRAVQSFTLRPELPGQRRALTHQPILAGQDLLGDPIQFRLQPSTTTTMKGTP